MGQAEGFKAGDGTCRTEGCDRPQRSKTGRGNGLCHTCQARQSYHKRNPGGVQNAPGWKGRWKGVLCSVEGCDRQVSSRGLCAKHYHQKHVPPKSSESARRARIRHRYNITEEQYEEMVLAQGGCCAICREPPSKHNTRAHWNGKLCIDHDHVTGRVRGLLCNDCNLAVGYGKSPERLLSAARYLRLHNG